MDPHRKGQGRSRRGALLAALMLPMALLLSGCQLNAAFSVTSGGMLVADIEFRDETGTLRNADVDCASFGISSADFPGTLQADMPDGATAGEVACRIHGVAENAVGSGMLADSGSTYTLTLDKSMIQGLERVPMSSMARLQSKIVVKMPGEIVNATPGGKVEGSKVTYSNPAILQAGQIVVEGKKSDGISPLVWVFSGLAAAMALVGGGAWFSRRRRLALGDGDPDHAEVVSPGQFAESASGEELKVQQHVEKLAPASTSESAVNVEPLPEHYEIDSESIEFSEEIGMVAPQEQGAGADAVQREASKVLPAIPAANTQTSPIPGMPPRVPMPDELMADFGVADSREAVPAIPEAPAMPEAPAGEDVGGGSASGGGEGGAREEGAAGAGDDARADGAEPEAHKVASEPGEGDGVAHKRPEARDFPEADSVPELEPVTDFSVNPDDLPDFQTGGTPAAFFAPGEEEWKPREKKAALAVPGVGDVPELPDIDGPIDEETASQMPPRIPFEEDVDIAERFGED